MSYKLFYKGEQIEVKDLNRFDLWNTFRIMKKFQVPFETAGKMHEEMKGSDYYKGKELEILKDEKNKYEILEYRRDPEQNFKNKIRKMKEEKLELIREIKSKEAIKEKIRETMRKRNKPRQKMQTQKKEEKKGKFRRKPQPKHYR
ncbi:MAG: hypothetical protein AB1467_04250 [Candidatus Diapherotrites archaeon]